jgi:hypothetical protein
MVTIGHQQSLINQSKMIWHLWLTSRRLLEEVDRQWQEAREVFTWMERMGLQQELYGSRFTASPVWGRLEQSTTPLSSQPSYSPPSSQLSQFHSCEETVINDDLSDYHESEAPLASLLSLPPPPLGTIENPIVISRWQRWYQNFAQSSKLSGGTIDVRHSNFITPSLSRLYQLMPYLLWMPSIHLRPLSDVCSLTQSIWLPKSLKPVTSILVGDNVTNVTFLLFFFDMWLPYAFYFTYLNTSLPAGVHESPNTCATCVCLTVNTPFSPVHHAFNMQIRHVHDTFYYYLNW